MRVAIDALFAAIQTQFAAAVPGTKHFQGRLEEGFSAPAFYYFLLYQGEKRINPAISKRSIEIQVIYFAKTDGYGRESQKERLQVQAALDSFFSQFYLEIGDRRLHFDYEIKDTDGHLTYYLTFAFYDDAIDARALAEEKTEVAESMDLQTKVTGK